MCNLFKKKEETKPDWITQSRKEVAKAEIVGAETHLAVLAYYEDHPELVASYEPWWGSVEHNEYWALKHQEAAWYTEHPETH